MQQYINQLRRALNSLVLSVKAHPDYTGQENDEWTDLVETAMEALVAKPPSEAEGQGEVTNIYDLTALSKEEQNDLLQQIMRSTTAALMQLFYSLGLKSHMDQMSKDTLSGDEFILSFRKVVDNKLLGPRLEFASHPAASGPVESDFETALEAEVEKIPDRDGFYIGRRDGFSNGAKWARQYLSPKPVEGAWRTVVHADASGEDVNEKEYITDGGIHLRIDGGLEEDSFDKLAYFMNAHNIKLWSDDPSPLIISHLEEQIKHLQSQQAVRLDADELWDEYSERVDDDIDSLQNVAGCSVMLRRQFDKFIAKVNDSPAPEPVNPVEFHKWMRETGWTEHSSGNYYYRLEYNSQWPPLQQNMCDESELLSKYTALFKNKQ